MTNEQPSLAHRTPNPTRTQSTSRSHPIHNSPHKQQPHPGPTSPSAARHQHRPYPHSQTVMRNPTGAKRGNSDRPTCQTTNLLTTPVRSPHSAHPEAQTHGCARFCTSATRTQHAAQPNAATWPKHTQCPRSTTMHRPGNQPECGVSANGSRSYAGHEQTGITAFGVCAAVVKRSDGPERGRAAR